MISPTQINIKLKEFTDKSYIKYSTGNFDDLCIYICYSDGTQKAPHDIEYLNYLNNLKINVPAQKLYNDFVSIYNHTSKEIEFTVLVNEIDIIARSYDHYSLIMNKIFSILYLGMLSEENKKNTKLGRRIKRLGIHEVLVNNNPPDYAANFMRGMTWQQIDGICKNYGF